MAEHIVFLLTGLGQGSVFAALALGLVVTYKGTGVINFAAGAIGVWAALVSSELRATGRLVLPVGTVPFGGPVAAAPAVALGVVVAISLGVLLHLAVFRPLRVAPPLAKVVASAGCMLALQSLAVLRFGVASRVVPAILPAGNVSIGTLSVPRDRLWLAAVVVALTVVVVVWFRWARTGLAIRAAADDERAAALAGLSPNRLAGVAWALAAALTGFMAALASPVTGINPTTFTLFVVPALACALIGRLRSIGTAVAAGLALGAINAEVTYLATSSWWPSWATAGVAAAVPLVVVVVALFAFGRSLPTRDSLGQLRLPPVPRLRLRPGVIVAALTTGLVAISVTGASYRFGLVVSMAVSIVALSFVVLTGYLGQVSLAQAAFAGLAGLLLSKLADGAGIPFPLAPLLAALGAATFGVLVGLPALRIRGVQLAVVTLAVAYAFEQVVLSNNALNGAGGNPVPGPRLFGVDLTVRGGTDTARWPFAALTLFVLFAAALLVANLSRSATGRQFLAVRSNERAAASFGIDVTRTKLFGFGLSAFLAGLGGTLIAYAQGSVSATSYTTFVGISWLLFAYLGGIASIGGALTAGLFATLGVSYVVIDRFIGTSGPTYQLLAAVGLIVTVIVNQRGIADSIRRRLDRTPPAVEPVNAALPAPAPATAGSTPRPAAGAVVLQTHGLSVRFGGVTALADVDLECRAGEIVGLIGANGAGKTTLIDAVTGMVSSTGQVAIAGRNIEHLPAYRRARTGLGRAWQSGELFSDLTVRENVAVAANHTGLLASLLDLIWPGRRRSVCPVEPVLDSMGLTGVADCDPTTLPLGTQKLVSVARALAGRPKVVLLDEPAAGLSTAESAAVGNALRHVVSPDVGVLLVEHDVAMVFDVCDRIYVLDQGRVIASGSAAEVRSSPAVVASYLGAVGPTCEPMLT